MREIVIREDRISATRRFFGILFLLIAFGILAFVLDKSLCVFSGIFENSCRQMNIEHPNWDLIKEALNQKSLKLFKGPLGIGFFLFLFFSVPGTFFGFFHGKQVFYRGQIILKNYLFGMCIRTNSMATLSHYKEIKLIKEIGSLPGPYGTVREGISVFHVNLVGGSEPKGLGIFLKYDEAKAYSERLATVIGLPLKNEAGSLE